ncbi:hypothetical protein GCM10009122_23260 [Fulvivirga kasyanovii]|uniref:DUF4359 domain-containing protein n=1 Tax=Fulvivirga kasyanovii TaxID=396812 RepID=A0ABW9S047_9BACT|nr:hypothetical protein [Fulvivirga kasyanovii]MTI28968.1 hypothetical protein [Fulvivirga kasyanovii]
MKINRETLKITGATAATLLVVALLYSWKRKRQDRLAARFMEELNKQLTPATAGLSASAAFDLDYKDKALKKAGSKILVLKEEAAKQYADEIHNSWGWINDEENRIYAVFRKLKDKVQVSQVSVAYNRYHKENLIDTFYDRMNDNEIRKILDIVNSKPDYRKP